MKMNLSHHATNDRMNRLLYIAENIGFGEVKVQEYRKETNSVECLTDTGIIIIKKPDSDKLITAWIADMQRAHMLCKGAGLDRIPGAIANKIRKNVKYAKSCPNC